MPVCACGGGGMESDNIKRRQVRSKNVSHANMWPRERTSSAESVSLPLPGQCVACFAVTFSTFCAASEGFRLNHANFSTSLSVMTALHLGVLDCVDFLFFMSLTCR